MLILASQSPRRQQLLFEHGYSFQVIAPDPDAESGDVVGESVDELVTRLAFQKAANVAQKIDSGIILACDTVAECQGIVLGKPRDREHAFEMLDHLRGKTHYVYSGLVIWEVPSGHWTATTAVSKLFMHPISDDQLNAYLDTGQWLGKSGAFGFQDGPDWLELVEGSASNVVGLPMDELQELLKQFH